MVEFNEDGSIKLPAALQKSKQDKEYRMKVGRCMLIRKNMISFTSPKKCMLKLRLSDPIDDNGFVEKLYQYFCNESQVPTKLTKLNEKEFEVEVGTDFRRCSDCTKLINKFRGFLEGNIIEEKGNCSYERNSNFCYEDYF